MFIGHMCVIILLLVLSGSFARGKLAAQVRSRVRAKGGNRDREEAACLFLKNWLFLMALCYCPLALSALIEEAWLYYLGIAVFVASAVGGLIYAGVKGYFRENVEK